MTGIKRHLEVAIEEIELSRAAGGNEAETRHLRLAIEALIIAIREIHR